MTFSGLVLQFDVDPQRGVLTPKSPASVGALSGFGLAVNPDGRSVYVADNAAVSQYSIDAANGALTPKSPPFVAAGGEALAVVVAPDGRSAYVANSFGNSVSQYDVDPANGALSPKTPATLRAGSEPSGIAVLPRPRAPTNKAQCKGSGWRAFPQFKDMGSCVSFIRRGG
jgi:DNA-binding beta-propeller fold protein YncE